MPRRGALEKSKASAEAIEELAAPARNEPLTGPKTDQK